MKIITLTLNPAFDTHCQTDTLMLHHENFASITASHAGGKGINLSRALAVNGTDHVTVVVVGEENSESFLRPLQKAGLRLRTISVPGRIRENLTIHTGCGQETRISFGGFPAPHDLLPQLKELLQCEIEDDTILTVTGRNTEGLSKEEIKNYLKKLSHKGVRLVIDSRSFNLNDLTELKPWLIKPNQEEISQYLGRSVQDFEQVRSAAQELHTQGIANVMVSLGPQGALLVCKEGTMIAVPPEINARSTIGAGDSSIAGFLSAAIKGYSAEESLKTAVAYGTAACLTDGSLPPLPSDIAAIEAKIKTTVY